MCRNAGSSPQLGGHLLALAEHRAWVEGEVAQFAGEAERDPATKAVLFRIALSRLDNLKLDLEEGMRVRRASCARPRTNPNCAGR